MDSSTPADVVLVLNAGSSSLKFAMYASAGALAWQAVARGQIEGIGTAPHLSVRDGEGTKVADSSLDPSVRDGGAAIGAAFVSISWGRDVRAVDRIATQTTPLCYWNRA